MVNQRKNTKRNHILQFALSVVIIVLINIIGKYIFTRFDLTEDKRYSLSPATKQILNELDDIVFIKVYLEGDVPSGFKRLRNETKETLNEFRAYSHNIEFEFIDPGKSKDLKQRNLVYEELVRKGLNPTDLYVKGVSGSQQKILFPGAIISYGSKENPLQLLKNQIGLAPESVLNNSVQSLEYNLINAIQKITKTQTPKIAFIYGHNELGGAMLYDAKQALSEYYIIENVSISGKINSLTKHKELSDTSAHIKNKYKAIIIVQPYKSFDEKDKFIIDQYLMNGGNMLWLIDPVLANMDSLSYASQTMSMPAELNLDDLLFKYGVKLKKNLVLDLNALPIPIATGNIGGQPQIDMLPWYYFPLITPTSEHPIVKNLNTLKTEFVSSIELLENQNSEVKKTILLQTSAYSRIIRSPSLIDLDMLRDDVDERLYTTKPQTIAVLLEGQFTSFFENRMPPEIQNSKLIGFKNKSNPAKILLVSDGDIIKNQLHEGKALPLGYDRFTRQTFGNKDFILNAVHYLTDDTGLMTVRSREVKIRLLDKAKIKNQKKFWQIINVIIPVLLIIALGLVLFFYRKWKYSR